MCPLSYIPSKTTLLLLLQAAARRVSEQTDDIDELQKARIIAATEELNQIADEARAVQSPLAALPSAPAHQNAHPTLRV